MSDHDYKQGQRDGEKRDYHPPVKERIFTDTPKDEKERLDDYRQGYRHGQEDIKKK